MAVQEAVKRAPEQDLASEAQDLGSVKVEKVQQSIQKPLQCSEKLKKAQEEPKLVPVQSQPIEKAQKAKSSAEPPKAAPCSPMPAPPAQVPKKASKASEKAPSVQAEPVVAPEAPQEAPVPRRAPVVAVPAPSSQQAGSVSITSPPRAEPIPAPQDPVDSVVAL